MPVARDPDPGRTASGARYAGALLTGFYLAAALALLIAVAAPAAAAAPTTSHVVATSALPPGESGYFPAATALSATGAVDTGPSSYPKNVDDQRLLYWNGGGTKPAPFDEQGAPSTPSPGVRIYRDGYGVPSIDGDNAYDVWYGAGYAAATDRLFEMDAVRHLAEGRLAELTGPSSVPADLAERTVTYTPAEYQQMYDRLDGDGKAAISGYAAGAQARIAAVDANPTLLPAEYVVLSTTPAPWTVTDTLAAGVYITRSVAAQGGAEMNNVAQLRTLEQTYGKANGRKAFDDLFTENDPKAVVTIPGATFSNLPAADRSAAAQARNATVAEDYADTLPLALATGPGTGASPTPGVLPTPVQLSSELAGVPGPTATVVARAVAGLTADVKALHGGSFAYAVAGSRTADGHALLSSNPQLDYSYPGELWELQVHGGGYDARGVSVPGIPTVGIGWTPYVAWGLTTGYSKTIDSFIETTRTVGGVPQYLHDGAWVDESCRTETISYRAAAMGVPAGPALESQTDRICRTVHGPVVATAGDLARSVDYAQWRHDDDTVEGILQWDRARSLADIAAGVAKVAWNENIVAADDAGRIGYWHPGRYLARAAGLDQRFPTPGTGAYDPTGLIPFAAMPHVVDPAAGYVANWNTKPDEAWVDGDLSGSTTRPGGPANRLTAITAQLAAAHRLRPADLTAIDVRVGESDMRASAYRPLLVALSGTSLTTAERQAVTVLLGWDGRAYAPGQGSSPTGTAAADVTDGPAATLFGGLVPALNDQLFAGVPATVRTDRDTLPVEGHRYDVTPLDNVALRVLRPGFSGVTDQRDWLAGRTTAAVTKAALDAAVAAVTKTYGSPDPTTWRRAHAVSHLNSLSGAVGPTMTMPFEDRGSWVEHVAFTTGRPQHSAAAVPARRTSGELAFTGSSPLLPLGATLLLATGAAAGYCRHRTARNRPRPRRRSPWPASRRPPV